MTKSLFSVTGLECHRQGRILFQNLSLHVPAGGILLLTGPNGCGKTTLLEIIAGLLTPTKGHIETTSPVCFLPANDSYLHPLQTVEENLLFWARIMNVENISPAMETAGLSALRHRPVHSLSNGQKRRVSLARLFLNPEAPLWLMDEPFNALDTDMRKNLQHRMTEHCRQGGGIALASHMNIPPPQGVHWQQVEVGA